MEQKTMIAVVRKWWVVLIAVAIVGGIVARGVAAFLQPTYESTVRLLTGPTSADLSTLEAAGALARTYSELATSQPQLQAVAAELGLILTPDQLAEDVNSTSNDVTRVVAIRVRRPTAEGAQQFATRLGDRMVALSNEGSKRDGELADELLRQDAFVGLSEPQRRIIREAASTVLGTQRAPGTLSVVDPARVATGPVSPRTPLLVLLGAFCGLALAGAVIVTRERQSGTIDDARSLAAAVDAPVLGTVSGWDLRSDLVVRSKPGSDAAVQVRRLADEISYHARDGSAKSLVLLGAEHGGPSGAVAANLAAALAAPDLRVMVVDADPDRADVTRLFRLSNHSGLSDFVRGDDGHRGAPDVVGVVRGADLTVIPAGASGGVHRRLDSKRVREIVESLESECEIVLIVPPALERSSDALVWAEQTDGTVIVAEQGATATGKIIRVGDDVRAVRARIIGTVFFGARTIPGLGRLTGLPRRRTKPASRAMPGGILRERTEDEELSFEGPVASGSPEARTLVPPRRPERAPYPSSVDETAAPEQPDDDTRMQEQPVGETPAQEQPPGDTPAHEQGADDLPVPDSHLPEERVAETPPQEHPVDATPGHEQAGDATHPPPTPQTEQPTTTEPVRKTPAAPRKRTSSATRERSGE